ncbi:MAG: GumC family protein [Aestuariivirga sp.]
MSQVKPMGEQIESVSLGDVLKGIMRRKLFIAVTTLLGVLAGVAVLYVFKPAYQSEAQVIIENLQTPFEKANSLQTDGRTDPIDKTVVLSQVSVLSSADVASRVVEKLDLTKNPEFNTLLQTPGMGKRILVALGFADDPKLFAPQELALKNLDQHLTVYQIPESNVIGVKFAAGEKQVAADVANAIVDIYVTSTREAGTSDNSRAKEWLSQQITDLRATVSASEGAVEKYRSEAGLLKGERTTLSTQQVSELNSQIVVAQTAAGEAQARVTEIKSMMESGSIDASSDVLNSPLIQNLKQAQVAAQRRLSELSAIYLPNHPKMVGAQADLTNVNNQLRREALKIVDSLQSQAKIANARAASLKGELDKLKGQEATNNISDVKLQELERNADADRKLLESLLGRYADVSSRQDMNLQPGLARIIQKALPAPAPYFPKPGPIMLLTTLAGLMMGLGLSFLAEVVAISTRSADVVLATGRKHPAQKALDAGDEIPTLPMSAVGAEAPLPVLEYDLFPAAPTAAASLAMVEQALVDERSELAEGAKALGERMVDSQTRLGFKTFSVMSLGSNAPNAEMAIVATARALAAAKLKVIAIDLSPSGHGAFNTLFGLPNGQGIVDLLVGSADFTKVVVRDPQSTAHVMRFGMGTGLEEFHTVQQRLGQIVGALSSIYSIIILHLGEASAATPVSAGCSDVAVILATEARLKDAIVAGHVLDGKGVKATITLRLDTKQEKADQPRAATA